MSQAIRLEQAKKKTTKYANKNPQNEINCYKLNLTPTIKNLS